MTTISPELVRLVRAVASDDPPRIERYRILRNRLMQEISSFDIRDLAEYNRQLGERIAAQKAAYRAWTVVNPDKDAC